MDVLVFYSIIAPRWSFTRLSRQSQREKISWKKKKTKTCFTRRRFILAISKMDKKNQFLYVKRLLNGFRGRNKARVFFFTSVDYKMSRYENVDLKINYIKKKKTIIFQTRRYVVCIESRNDFRINKNNVE